MEDINALFAGASALLGAIIGSIGSWIVQRHAAARSNRGEACAAFLLAADEAEAELRPLLKGSLVAEGDSGVAWMRKQRERVDRCHDELVLAWERFLLLATDEAQQTSARLFQLITDPMAEFAEQATVEERARAVEGWEARAEARLRLKAELRQAARKDLIPLLMRREPLSLRRKPRQ